MQRVIGYRTDSVFKCDEARRTFGPYGIEVVQLSSPSTVFGHLNLLLEPTSTRKFIALMEEHTQLVKFKDVPAIAKDDKQESSSSTLTHGAIIRDCSSNCAIIHNACGNREVIDSRMLNSQCKTLHLCPCTHVSTLIVTFVDKTKSNTNDNNGCIVTSSKTYHAETDGYLDMDKRVPRRNIGKNKKKSSGVAQSNKARRFALYDWDDIFITIGTNKSYHELHEYKISARDKNLASFVRDYIRYKEKVSLSHTSTEKHKEVIDFNYWAYDFITSVPEYNDVNNNGLMKHYGLDAIIKRAVAQGLFFRKSENRRQKLYWIPGLNAGLPFTPKPKDRSHELTYMFHDFVHFIIPDLMYDGGFAYDKKLDDLHRTVYVCYRLMSEVVTLAMGDMIFVDCMLKSGYSYETVDKRCIYPVFLEFEAKNGPITSMTKERYIQYVRDILQGSLRFCFFGDLSVWKSMMQNPDHPCLQDFANKYNSYIVEDARWSSANYKNMQSNRDSYQKWWETVGSVPGRHEFALQSVSNFIGEQCINVNDNYETITRRVFDAIMFKYVIPGLSNLKTPVWDFFASDFESDNSDDDFGYLYGDEVAFPSPPPQQKQEMMDGATPMDITTTTAMVASSYDDEDNDHTNHVHVNGLCRETSLRNAFLRWAMGQMFAFHKFPASDEQSKYGQILMRIIESSELITKTSIGYFRFYYNEYMKYLEKMNFITEDDRLTYAQMFPIFKPVIINYDDVTYTSEQVHAIVKSLIMNPSSLTENLAQTSLSSTTM